MGMTDGSWQPTSSTELPKSFFPATTRSGQSPAGPDGGPEIRLRWLGNDSLMLAHHANAHLVRAATTSRLRVPVTYRSVRPVRVGQTREGVAQAL